MSKQKITPLKLWNKWCKIPQKERNSYLAKQMAKQVCMKSMGEVRLAAWLEENKYEYEYEPEKWEYQHKVQHYIPDFKLKNGVYIEYKGKMVNETLKKLISIKRCNPDKILHIAFEKPNNKLRKGAKMTYWKWAEREHFDWSEQLPKLDWLN